MSTSLQFQPPDTFQSDMAGTKHTKLSVAMSDTQAESNTSHTRGQESNVLTRDVRMSHSGDTTQDNRSESEVESKNGDGKHNDGASTQTSLSPTTNLDIAASVPDFYRVLDLIYDRGSGGLVDKIIIEQESLGRLINVLRPNAYTSITKVDFSALDHVQVRAIGLYGSKSAIVDFLRQNAIVDKETALAMLQPIDTSINPTQPTLRSGMYVHMRGGEDIMHVIYWPEDTTWDDNCVSSVSKNRITFMRYLTKICDQVVCLMSDEHARAIVWRRNNEDSDQESDDDDDGGAGRLFAFEVSKTNEQEEGVTVQPGFEVHSPLISPGNAPHGVSAPPDNLRPRLVRGELEQGIITAQYVAEQRQVRHETETINDFRLKDIMRRQAICFSDSLSIDTLEILFDMKCPFGPSVEGAITQYRVSVSDVKKVAADKLKKGLDDMHDRVDKDSGQLLASITELLMSQVMTKFPLLAGSGIQLAGIAKEPKDVPLPPDDDHLQNLCLMFEGVELLIHEASKVRRLNAVTADRYNILKERILGLDYLFSMETNLTNHERRELVSTTLRDGFDRPLKSGVRRLINASKRAFAFVIGTESSASRAVDVPENVVNVDDDDFLLRLPDIVGRSPLLLESGMEITELAMKYFSTTVEREAKDLARNIQKIQRKTFREQITRECQIAEKKQLEDLRVGILCVLRSNWENDKGRCVRKYHRYMSLFLLVE
ncbi:hypothetical protein GSI_00681 [Ganoderma sinense ZZ0214-1]|uniref:Uncharacterized protein n=1 Tax=Ganoderma sinense ZZ0214-1 TaxID=1077348 RepID=A0A2G8ST86_9APHY|nr:hypothetical protein GSI_00681 [Ganoderma sinense ZZ0214-1]